MYERIFELHRPRHRELQHPREAAHGLSGGRVSWLSTPGSDVANGSLHNVHLAALALLQESGSTMANMGRV